VVVGEFIVAGDIDMGLLSVVDGWGNGRVLLN